METIINGKMIQWARERARLSPAELAEKCKTDPETVRKWESGERAITVTKAKQLAKIALIPYGLLFADNPPEEKIPIADYRTQGSAGIRRPSPELLETIDDAKLKQEWYREYLIAEEFPPLGFIGKYDTNAEPEFIAQEIKRVLGVDDTEYYACKDWEQAFSYLINHAEDEGITVLVNSTLKNNTHRPLDVEEFRGFVLSDSYAPLIFINGKDAKAARMFTLMHEIAHLFIGESGVCDDTIAGNGSIPQEQWCNQVAAEFLTPKDRFLELWKEGESADSNLDTIRLRLRVSRLVAIFRAYQLNLISYEEKQEFVSTEMTHFAAIKTKQKDTKGGPDYYVIKRFKTGRNLAMAIISEVRANRMLYRDAFHLLGVKNIEALNTFAGALDY
ncbi:XRE family transcriptional regulator [Methanogenium sp. S4BF]|uniref:XRE family transcriptional regulator n=1 Tax=Methanogenium sp. S4BF TaxID=1789226 RepID=UPI0024177983|nr:XRE family transcriptional regulator [Methanogenium sp. S4BF]WFN33465.1 XRE family transcriptional regulator [Methanogenium sp. S4BF]